MHENASHEFKKPIQLHMGLRFSLCSDFLPFHSLNTTSYPTEFTSAHVNDNISNQPP